MVAALPSVFLSYARSDDEPFVGRLRDALEGEGFQVWWDRASMRSRALPFQQEIRDAIDAHDRTILIVGPAAVRSDYVRAEWQYALAAEKVVSPVLRLGERAIIPAELRTLHYVDALEKRDEAKAIAEILGIAADPPAPVGQCFHVPKAPLHFRPRIEDFSRLAGLFQIDQPSRIALPASERSVVLQGMAGLGKSVLAASLARSTALRRQFPDGIVWLGYTAEERSPLERLRTLGLALGGDVRDYDSADVASQRLGKLLETKAALVVLDNVWFAEQAHPFTRALGRRCQMLVTTRDAELAGQLKAELCSLALLSLDDSRRLLADWVKSTPEALPEEANRVAEECGRLPFALALAGAMAAAGTAWPDLLAALRNADLAFVRKEFPDYPYSDLLRAQQASLDVLQGSRDAGQARAAEQYLQISAFRWDRPVPEAALVTLWRATGAPSDLEARESLTTLAGKALLRVEGASPDRRVFLHDLQHDFLRFRAPQRAAAHQSILDAYDRAFPDGPLTAADDGYYFDSLFHHLEEAGRAGAMHALLRREDGDGRNAWWARRIALGQAFGFDADVRRAWNDALRGAAAGTGAELDPGAVALMARYALVSGSFRDALAAVPLALVRSLVAHGVWTADHALAAGRWHRSESLRVEGLAAALPRLDGQARQDAADEALALVRTFPEAGDRARSLLKVAAGLAGEQRRKILGEVVALVRNELPDSLVDCLKDAWVLQPDAGEWLDEAVAKIAETRDAAASAQLAELAGMVPQDRLPALLQRARDRLAGDALATALLAVAPRLEPAARGALAGEACRLARDTGASHGLWQLARAARWLEGEQRRQVVAEVLAGLAPERREDAMMALAILLPVLDRGDRVDAEKALYRRIAEERSAATIRGLLAELATPGGLDAAAPDVVQLLIEPMLEAISRDAGNPGARADALALLAGRLDERQRRKVLEDELLRAQIVADRSDRARCLMALAGRLGEAAREPVVGRLLELPNVLAALTDFSPGDLAPLMRMATLAQLEQAAATSSERKDRSDLAVALAIGFAHRGAWRQFFRMLSRTRGAGHLGRILSELPAEVPADVPASILTTADRTGDAQLFAAAIPPLLGHLDAEDRSTVLDAAMGLLTASGVRFDRARLAHALLPDLPCDRVDLVHRRLKEQPGDFHELAKDFRQRLASALLRCGRGTEALEIAWSLGNADDCGSAMAELAAIESPLKAQLATWAEEYAEKAWPDTTVAILVRLASLADGVDRRRLLAKAARIAEAVDITVDNGWRGTAIDPRQTKARALLRVAPHLDDDRRRDFLLEAWRLAPRGGGLDPPTREELSGHLGRLQPRDLLPRWQERLDAASGHRADVFRELAAFADVAGRLGGDEAVEAIVVAVEDVARWWPDAARAP